MKDRSNDPAAWWREARFGMFIHWGLYAIPAGEWKGERIPGIGEWIMKRAHIPIEEYAALAREFNPVKFDAEEWVRIASEAGMKYLVITSKHHDGFAMFKSEHPYNIVDATAFKKDPMADLAAACRKAGIKLGFYHSQSQDWHAPGGAGHWENEDRIEGNRSGVTPAEFAEYLERKVKPQVRELLTQYGPLGLIWFDTPQCITEEQSLELKQLVHEIQPDCLVSGRVGNDLGDYGSLGDNEHPVGPLEGDWETPCTLNDTWGFKHYDHNWKSPEYLIRLLVNCASKGVNYLLNVGPTAEGTIPEPSIERLRAVGKWMKTNGEAIYGTQASPFPYDFEWGRITCKPGKIYLHFMDWPGRKFTLTGLRTRVENARVLAGGSSPVEVTQTHDGKADEHLVALALPEKQPDSPVSVVALEIEGEPDIDPLPLQQPDGKISLPAHMADPGESNPLVLDRAGAVTGWKNTASRLSWQFKLHQPGEYRVLVQTLMDRHRKELFGTHDVQVTIGSESLCGQAGRKDMVMDEQTNRRHVAKSDIGSLTVSQTGTQTLTLTAERIDPDARAGLTASGVLLVPVACG